MKRLIAIAVLASLGGAAYGAGCSYDPTPATSVYKWKFTGKTTYGKKPGKVKATVSLCGYNGSSGGSQDCVVRAPASLKIEGYTWYCEKPCGSSAFEEFAETDEIFWQKKPFKASLAGGVATDVANIIGKKATKFEAAGTAKFDNFINAGSTKEGSYTLTYAGIGAYSKKNDRVKNVKGNFAGFLSQPYYIGVTEEGKACPPAGFWNCDLVTLVCPGGTSVAYGKWSATYKKNASKKFSAGKWTPKTPSWVVWMNKK